MVLEVQKNLGLQALGDAEGIINHVFLKQPMYVCFIQDIKKNATIAILSPLTLYYEILIIGEVVEQELTNILEKRFFSYHVPFMTYDVIYVRDFAVFQ